MLPGRVQPASGRPRRGFPPANAGRLPGVSDRLLANFLRCFSTGPASVSAVPARFVPPAFQGAVETHLLTCSPAQRRAMIMFLPGRAHAEQPGRLDTVPECGKKQARSRTIRCRLHWAGRPTRPGRNQSPEHAALLLAADHDRPGLRADEAHAQHMRRKFIFGLQPAVEASRVSTTKRAPGRTACTGAEEAP